MEEDFYNQFNSSDDNSTMPDYFFLEYFVVPPLIGLITLAGLFGNGLLAYILRKTPASNAPYVCLLNLAIADLIVIIFYLPFAIRETFPFGESICKITETLADVSTGVSAFSLVAITWFSFFGREGVATQSEWSKKTVTVVVGIIWTLAIAFASPMLVFAHLTHEEYAPYQYCESYDPRYAPAEGPIRLIVYHIVPLSAVSIFFCIAKRNATANIEKDNSKLAIWLVVAYAIAFFPENLTTFWVLLPTTDDNYWGLTSIIAYVIGVFYRCLNPIVLYCVSDTFRKIFKEQLLYWFSSETREPVLEASMNREAGPAAEILSQRLL